MVPRWRLIGYFPILRNPRHLTRAQVRFCRDRFPIPGDLDNVNCKGWLKLKAKVLLTGFKPSCFGIKTGSGKT
jgi:hypothetical protein